MCLKKKMKSVVVGAGRLLDFSGSYNYKLRRKYLETDSRKLDAEALRSDWENIGFDMKKAMDAFKREHVS